MNIFTDKHLTCEIIIIVKLFFKYVIGLPPRKFKVDVYDEEGNKITISFEGRVTRNKILKLMDLVEIMGGVYDKDKDEKPLLTKIDKIRQIITETFPLVTFRSQDIQNLFEEIYNEPISLSTVSTYLSRLTSRGFLVRIGSPKKLHYRIRRVASPSEI